MMLAADAPIIRQAFDPIGFIVVAIIVFNIISALAGGARRAARRVGQAAAARSDTAAAVPSAAPSGSYQSAVAAARAAEVGRLRQVLLASGALPRAAAALQPYVVAATQKISAVAPPAAQVFNQSATAQFQMPGMFLMSLESGAQAFNQLAAPGLAGSADSGSFAATPHRRYGLFNGAIGAADAIVGAAIIGPCAALRPVGHTPGGW